MSDVHPLALLSADEINDAVAILRADHRIAGAADTAETVRFPAVRVAEPTKAELAEMEAGTRPIDRRVRVMVVPGPGPGVVDAVVSLTTGQVVEWVETADAHPTLLFMEAMSAINATRAHPEWQAAIRLRGIEDFEQVQIDPWPPGRFGLAYESERRIVRCISFWRETGGANGYARPIEGLLTIVDAARGEVLEFIDTGIVPLAPELGSYFPADQPSLRSDLKPIEITQPEGPSFTVDGNLVGWQGWQLRIGWDPFEGLVLHQVGYRDRSGASAVDELRPILHRAAVSEMVVPYGDTDPMHFWKNAFDAGEWGLGRMTTSLKLGCDCVGHIHYFDVHNTLDRGEPYVVANAICMHEEDYGILWKHVDMHHGTSEVRRSRRLVVSFVATVGNYEYGFFWYFYLDGTIQLEVKLTGIMSTKAMAIDAPASAALPYTRQIAPGLAAPLHQHLFNVRLDVTVDGFDNTVEEVNVRPIPPGPDNPWANAFVAEATVLETELAAIRDIDPAKARAWRIVNPTKLNGLGEPVAYKLIPGSTPTLHADPSSNVGRRAGFARHNLWVTPWRADERRAAGEYPNQSVGGDGLPRWTAADRPIVDTDIVVWHTFGVTHVPRPEDWPVMPVEYAGFSLVPFGFFDRNPALDLPPAAADGEHCHAETAEPAETGTPSP